MCRENGLGVVVWHKINRHRKLLSFRGPCSQMLTDVSHMDEMESKIHVLNITLKLYFWLSLWLKADAYLQIQRSMNTITFCCSESQSLSFHPGTCVSPTPRACSHPIPIPTPTPLCPCPCPPPSIHTLLSNLPPLSFQAPLSFLFHQLLCVFLLFIQPHLVIFLQVNSQIPRLEDHLFTQALF